MLLSIITINYNDKEGLARTMDSVLSQTYTDFEYIVIDGGSNDGSKAIIEQHQDQLGYWVSEADSGVYNAMNKGIKQAKGDYLLFLNSGDYLITTTAIADFITAVDTLSYDIIYGNLQVVGATPWVKTYPDELGFNYLADESLPHPSAFIKRACFEGNLYDETLKIVADWKFFIIGICRLNYSYKHINIVLSVFNLDGISSTQKALITKERTLVLEQEFGVLLNDYKQFKLLQKKAYPPKSKLYLMLRRIYQKIK